MYFMRLSNKIINTKYISMINFSPSKIEICLARFKFKF